MIGSLFSFNILISIIAGKHDNMEYLVLITYGTWLFPDFSIPCCGLPQQMELWKLYFVKLLICNTWDMMCGCMLHIFTMVCCNCVCIECMLYTFGIAPCICLFPVHFLAHMHYTRADLSSPAIWQTFDSFWQSKNLTWWRWNPSVEQRPRWACSG